MRSTDCDSLTLCVNHLKAGHVLTIPTDVCLPAFTSERSGQRLRHFPRWVALRIALAPEVKQIHQCETCRIFEMASD